VGRLNAAARGDRLRRVERPGAKASIRVLLADDDERYLASLRVLVEEQPELSVVAQAANGLDAIEAADAVPLDAAVIDLHMPLVDGVTAVARLRRDHPSLCVIAITGDREPRLLHAAEEAGADAVLLKEELVETLVERLRTAKAKLD
jgi:DNA-binding NarL/FixJ family response regulator